MRPNILFFLPDQHRADWLGINENLPLRTPNLNELCSNGIFFVNAFTPSPLCAPARACLATGLNYQKCKVPNNSYNMPLDIPTYYQVLRSTGYYVYGVGKFDLHKKDLYWNIDGSHLLSEWGFSGGIDNEGKLDATSSYKQTGKPQGPYMAYLHKIGFANKYVDEHNKRHIHKDAYITELPEEAYCDNWVAENGLNFLRNFPKDKPWHLVVNFTGPHNPMDVTHKMHQNWQDINFPYPIANEQKDYSPEDHQRNRRYYAAMIENIDRHIGRYMNLLQERNEIDNTLIVFSSDHGEMLGDHNLWGKSVPFHPSIRIPMILAGPSIPKNKKKNALVSLHDLTATFLDYAGIDKLLPESDSLSLRKVIEGKTEIHRNHIVSGLNNWICVFDGRYKLILQKKNSPVLYDLSKDPNELNNIAIQYPELVKKLQNYISTNNNDNP
ncbi:MAG TPA: sulfatase-like hydrolase/transferase [Victivallales bacterium]|nr:sulfatase-like hydrolase/transferase [Victivallales bacterium]HRR28121.1 sulfatase-like hydrolase/transferase [Victivallales bacterium]